MSFNLLLCSLQCLCVSPRIDLSDEVPSAPNEDCMQKLCPQEVDVLTTPIGAHKPFGVSSSGVRVLDV
jgi:hypothetical protein